MMTLAKREVRMSEKLRAVAGAVVLSALSAAFAAQAQPAAPLKVENAFAVPPGAKVSVVSSSVRLVKTGHNPTVTVTCGCAGASGSCTIAQNGAQLFCSKTNHDSCTGTCKMSTTTEAPPVNAPQ